MPSAVEVGKTGGVEVVEAGVEVVEARGVDVANACEYSFSMSCVSVEHFARGLGDQCRITPLIPIIHQRLKRVIVVDMVNSDHLGSKALEREHLFALEVDVLHGNERGRFRIDTRNVSIQFSSSLYPE